jgi:hypothetical protein
LRLSACASPRTRPSSRGSVSISRNSAQATPNGHPERQREAASLDGWRICSIRGNQLHATLSGSLGPGESRAIESQAGGSIWSNSSRDDGALYDAEGRLVSYWLN